LVCRRWVMGDREMYKVIMIIIVSAYNGGAHTNTIDFSSIEECRIARHNILLRTKETNVGPQRHLTITCVETTYMEKDHG